MYHGAGRIQLEERPDPVAGPGELLVRVRACGLCGSDLMQWYQDPRAPVVLGHEPVGEVVQVGAGATVGLGARVFVHHHVPCMTCDLCRAGRHTLCARFRTSRIDPGGLAELIRVPAENARLDVLEVPDAVSDAAATLIEPLACVVRGQRQAGVGPGSRVAVVGAGAMGLLEIAAARAAGAVAVVAIDPREDRRALAGRPAPTRWRATTRSAWARPSGARPTASSSAPMPRRRSRARSISPVPPAWFSCSRRRPPGRSSASTSGPSSSAR